MAAKLHVTNLSQTITDSDLNRLFAGHGTVREARVLVQGGGGGAGGWGWWR